MKFLSCLFSILCCVSAYAQPVNYPNISYTSQSFSRIIVDNAEGASQGNRWTPIAVFKNDVHTLYGDNNGIYYSFSEDNGTTWKKETLIKHEKLNHVGNTSIAPFNAEVETDCEGAVHLFFIESMFDKGPSKLWHYKRARGKKEWKIEIVDKTALGFPHLGFDIDVVIDPKNQIHLVYNVAEKFTRYALYDGKKWDIDDIVYGNSPMGSSITVDSTGKPYILIGCHNNNVAVATRSSRTAIKWDFDEVGYLGTWPCDIALGKNGTLHVVYNPVMNTSHNIPFKYARKVKGGSWETKDYGLSSHGESNLYNGNNMRTRIKMDPLGRIHMVYYPHYENKTTRESLVYMISEDDGKTWKQQWMAPDANGYLESGYPDIAWNGKHIYIAYKSGEQPAIMRVSHNQKELGRQNTCEPPEEEKDSVVVVKDSVVVLKDTLVVIKDSITNPIKKDSSVASNLTPNDFHERKPIEQGIFKTDDEYITINVWDFGDIDGDTITLVLGDSCILYQYELTAKSKILTVKIKPGDLSKISLYAVSEGRKPPCTVAITIRDSKQVQRYQLSSNLKQNGYISLTPK
jgi:hypothetical protein